MVHHIVRVKGRTGFSNPCCPMQLDFLNGIRNVTRRPIPDTFVACIAVFKPMIRNGVLRGGIRYPFHGSNVGATRNVAGDSRNAQRLSHGSPFRFDPPATFTLRRESVPPFPEKGISGFTARILPRCYISATDCGSLFAGRTPAFRIVRLALVIFHKSPFLKEIARILTGKSHAT